jgi:hypothetical protein
VAVSQARAWGGARLMSVSQLAIQEWQTAEAASDVLLAMVELVIVREPFREKIVPYSFPEVPSAAPPPPAH